jgi:peptide chain release factor 2
VDTYAALHRELDDEIGMLEMADAVRDAAHIGEAAGRAHALDKRLQKMSLQAMFSQADDRRSAFLSLQAGAGGTDACDFARMLMRMYSRWAERNGYVCNLVGAYEGDEAGYRSATLEIVGEYAFGYLKGEIGVHRLVRISPFDANKRRHTAFCGVDVTPEQDEIDVSIDEKDLQIDVYSAGGPGGQHVNKTQSAVRIRHLPTEIVVQCQNERSQQLNRKMAMRMLTAKLHQHEESKRKDALAKLYGDKGEIAFGNRIRSYTLDPFQLVKDHRTDVETGKIEAVLDGEIDAFIEAFLRWKERKY